MGDLSSQTDKCQCLNRESVVKGEIGLASLPFRSHLVSLLLPFITYLSPLDENLTLNVFRLQKRDYGLIFIRNYSGLSSLCFNSTNNSRHLSYVLCIHKAWILHVTSLKDRKWGVPFQIFPYDLVHKIQKAFDAFHACILRELHLIINKIISPINWL